MSTTAYFARMGGGYIRIRFRCDIIEPLFEDARKALLELDKILTFDGGGTIEPVRIDLTPEILPGDTTVLMEISDGCMHVWISKIWGDI